MNIIQKALDEVKWEIPEEVLDLVFIQRNRYDRWAPESVDKQILDLIIRPRVMVDCNLVGGTEAFISLSNIRADMTEDYTTVYRIPKSKTQGRSIISVKNITFSDPTYMSSAATVANMGASQMLYAGQAVMNAHATIPTVSSAVVQLIGENVVMVRDNAMLPMNSYLRCILANDDQMSHIQLTSYPAFCKLVEYAVKAYIYVNRVVKMDKGQLFGGAELGTIKEIIDEYKDANELYRTYLREKWTKISKMNDRETFTRNLRRQIGGNR